LLAEIETDHQWLWRGWQWPNVCLDGRHILGRRAPPAGAVGEPPDRHACGRYGVIVPAIGLPAVNHISGRRVVDPEIRQLVQERSRLRQMLADLQPMFPLE
jgi:hypothetical protein